MAGRVLAYAWLGQVPQNFLGERTGDYRLCHSKLKDKPRRWHSMTYKIPFSPPPGARPERTSLFRFSIRAGSMGDSSMADCLAWPFGRASRRRACLDSNRALHNMPIPIAIRLIQGAEISLFLEIGRGEHFEVLLARPILLQYAADGRRLLRRMFAALHGPTR